MLWRGCRNGAHAPAESRSPWAATNVTTRSATSSDGLTTEARKELRELKRDVRRLRMERDILDKATA